MAYLVRNTFKCRPGQTKKLVEKFAAAAPLLKEGGHVLSTRVMTDAVSTFWTVVVESEVENLDAYFNLSRDTAAAEKIGAAMAGYMDHVEGGHREIFKIEASA